jgi:hypothetical protein
MLCVSLMIPDSWDSADVSGRLQSWINQKETRNCVPRGPPPAWIGIVVSS